MIETLRRRWRLRGTETWVLVPVDPAPASLVRAVATLERAINGREPAPAYPRWIRVR